LKNIDLTVAKGEWVFVLGRSGVGKSVLLRIIVGLIPKDTGEVALEKTLVDYEDEKAISSLRKRVGLVFQKPALIDNLSIEGNILFGLKERPKNFTEQVTALGLKKEDLKLRPQEVSFGAQKKTSVLRTLLRKPDFLLFDEPTTSLDPISTEAMNQLMLSAVKQSGAGVIVVSHDIESALKYADRIVLLDSSQIIFQGNSSQFKKSDNETVKIFLGALLKKQEYT